MDFMNAIICLSNKYCTNCPIRVNCKTRENFYDDAQFQKGNDFATTITTSELSNMGVSKELIDSCISDAQKNINQKRQRELEEHPTFSKQ